MSPDTWRGFMLLFGYIVILLLVMIWLRLSDVISALQALR